MYNLRNTVRIDHLQCKTKALNLCAHTAVQPSNHDLSAHTVYVKYTVKWFFGPLLTLLGIANCQ